MADQNFRVKRGLEVGIGGTVISTLSTGNVGIGTTNPTSRLHVIGDTNIVGILTATSFRGDGSQLTGITAAAAVSISTNTTNQSQFIPYVTTTGSTAGFGVTTGGLVFNPSTTRLGIGTTSPRANLDVTDSILISTGVAQTAGFLIKSYTNNNGSISFENVDNTNPRFSIDRDTSYLLRVNDNSFATRLIVDSSGNLGIGTTVPTSRLHVIGDANIVGILTASSIVTNNIQGSLNNLQVTGISTFTNGPVFIGSGTSTGTSNQRLQVTGGAYVSGNLGIGTTSPRANLDVTDSILISTGVAQTAGFLIKSYTNNNGSISFENVDNTNPRFSIDRDTSYLLRVNDNSFATRLIVDSSGNLGIGTTIPTRTLSVNGDIGIGRSIYDSTNLPGSVGQVLQSTATGIQWASIGGASTATNVIGGIGSITQLQVTGISTFTNGPVFIGSGTSTGTSNQRLQVTGGAYISGNLGIGTTNPTQPLHVQGNVRITGALFASDVGGISTSGTSGQVLQSVGTGISWVTPSAGGGSISISSNSTNQAQYLTFATGTGSTTGLGIDTNIGLVFNPSTERLGIGTTNPAYNLHVNGSFGATTKSFIINHPTKEGKKLQYGSLESPYHGIRLTGSSTIKNGNCVIELPEYIHNLVKTEDINIHITNIKHGKVLWVDEVDVENNRVTIMTEETNGEYDFYWDFTAIRKDIEDMIVEF